MSKKIIAILVGVLLAAAVLAGCGGPQAPQQSSSRQQQQSSQQTQRPSSSAPELEDGSYSFTNRAYLTIAQLRIAPTGTGEWSVDALEDGMLGMDNILYADVPAGGMNLDFEIVDMEGNYYYAYDVNVLPDCDVFMDAAQEGYAISVEYAEGGNAYIPMDGTDHPVPTALPITFTISNQIETDVSGVYVYYYFTESWSDDMLGGGSMAYEDWFICDGIEDTMMDIEFSVPGYTGILVRDVIAQQDDELMLVDGQDGYAVQVFHVDGSYSYYYAENNG